MKDVIKCVFSSSYANIRLPYGRVKEYLNDINEYENIGRRYKGKKVMLNYEDDVLLIKVKYRCFWSTEGIDIIVLQVHGLDEWEFIFKEDKYIEILFEDFIIYAKNINGENDV